MIRSDHISRTINALIPNYRTLADWESSVKWRISECDECDFVALAAKSVCKSANPSSTKPFTQGNRFQFSGN